jgi:hypothetical protein
MTMGPSNRENESMTAILNRILRRLGPDHRQVFREFAGALERLLARS